MLVAIILQRRNEMINEYGRTDSRLHRNKMKLMNKEDKEFLLLSESLNLTPEQTYILREYRADPTYQKDQETKFIRSLKKSFDVSCCEFISEFNAQLPPIKEDITTEIKELLTTKPKNIKWDSILTLKKK